MSGKMILIGAAACAAFAAFADYPCELPAIRNVRVGDGFWKPRLETNRLVTVWADFKKCEETGRIANFEKAGRREQGTFKGIPFDDSDVYKVVEGAALTLATHPDPKLEKYLDDLIAKFAAAQEPDGYLYTARTLGFEKTKGKGWYVSMMGPARFTATAGSHELYNMGHFYEAAVAYYNVTGKRAMLDVAIKNADLLCKTFGLGEGQNRSVPGHEEIEIGLCKLYRATGQKRYLDLAKHFIDMRGNKDRPKLYGQYCQDHIPVKEQTEAVGHAVRAGYLYCGVTDVAALANDASYVTAIERIWDNVVGKKLHFNGGIGARHEGEAFGKNYELPNQSAYLETCAAIANALWNERMFLMTGDAKYIDVLERTIYNGFLSGISISGDEFFYPNPQACAGGYARSKWFGCSCCPVNIVRFLPQVPQFAYARKGNDLYVNLFIAGAADFANATLEQATAYPWDGKVEIKVTPKKDGERFALHVRIPGWAQGKPVPSDLYTQVPPLPEASSVKLALNGAAQSLQPEKGYAVLDRAWKAGDTVTLSMDLSPRRVAANPAVQDDVGRIAVEVGPVIYCAEAVDNGGHALNLLLKKDASIRREGEVSIAAEKYPTLKAEGGHVSMQLSGKRSVQPAAITLIPYFAWCHRGADEMQMWLPFDLAKSDAALNVTVSTSYCNSADVASAACDNVLPQKSNDQSVPRMTWWDHRGTEEWIAYRYAEPAEVKGASVYWFEDSPKGGCRVPASWSVQARQADGSWKDVPFNNNAPVEKDKLCTAEFRQPVNASEFRLAVKLQKGFSGGVLEWKMLPK